MKIILASASGVRKQILEKYNIATVAIASNVDEDEVKKSLLSEGADPSIISKNLADSFASAKGNGINNRFLSIVFNNFKIISLNDKISGPIHSIVCSFTLS